jgi:uncharacterized protein HemX
MKNGRKEYDPVVYDELEPAVPEAPLFPPVLRRRRDRGPWRAIVVAVVLTLLAVGLAALSFGYQRQGSTLSDVKRERSQLTNDLAASRHKLSDTSGRLSRTNTKLATATKQLTKTRKKLASTGDDLAAAKAAATAQYSSGYEAGSGSSNVTYNNGWNAGYDSGWDYGYSAGYNTCYADYYC